MNRILLILVGVTILSLNHATPLGDWKQHADLDDRYLHLNKDEERLLMQQNGCSILLTESIPEKLTYPPNAPRHLSTYFAWKMIIQHATQNITISSFYWSLIAEPKYNQSAIHQGHHIFHSLRTRSKDIDLLIAQSGPKKPDSELDELIAAGAKIYWLDVAHLLGSGILHTKLWTSDRKHAYLGSANMDWRSLTEVKELGVLMLRCPKLVRDVEKIHQAYCFVSEQPTVPTKWPKKLDTRYNQNNPFNIRINGIPSRVYFTNSPKQFNPPGRTNDIDAILATIAKAEKFIYISVMDYSPEIVNYKQSNLTRYWPVIDDALKIAALDRGVEVRLLISRWPYTVPSMAKYLEALRGLNGIRKAKIRVRYFIVPSFTLDQAIIPHARVNHNKYMVTDKTAYIGTSNWSGDYFLFTGGAAFVVEDDSDSTKHVDSSHTMKPKSIRTQLVEIFQRDWNSDYAFEN